MTFLLPPADGGTDAGDVRLNSNVNWQSLLSSQVVRAGSTHAASDWALRWKR